MNSWGDVGPTIANHKFCSDASTCRQEKKNPYTFSFFKTVRLTAQIWLTLFVGQVMLGLGWANTFGHLQILFSSIKPLKAVYLRGWKS